MGHLECPDFIFGLLNRICFHTKLLAVRYVPLHGRSFVSFYEMNFKTDEVLLMNLRSVFQDIQRRCTRLLESSILTHIEL